MSVEKIPVQFVDKASPIHSIHPLTKFIWLFLISTLLIVNQDYVIETITLGVILGLFFLSGFNIMQIRGVRIAFSTSIFIALIQLIFSSDGNILFSFLGFVVTSIGMERAIFFSSRFFSIILIGFLFIMTSSPNILVYSFMQAGISYRAGFALISALRLMSIFSRESEKIFYSLALKGSSFSIIPFKTFFQRITNYFKLILVSIFEKVDAMVISMEGRGFGNVSKRTFLQHQQFEYIDYVLIITGIFVLGGYLFWVIIN
jgi:energy-coupling factor transport system permease protein